MHLITHFKNKSPSSGLYKKECTAILIILFCFALSGVFLPNTAVKAFLRSSLDLPAVEVTDTIQAELPADVSDKDTDTAVDKDKEIDDDLTDEDSKKEDSEEDDEKEDEKKDDTKKESEKKSDTNKADKKPSNTASNSSSSGSGSSGSTSSSGSASQAPAEKVWVPPVYKTVHHDAVYETVKVVVCNYCGAEFSSAGEFQVHKDANGG